MKTILFLSFITLSFNANADRFSSSPLCYKPDQPLMFSTAYYIDRYNKDVMEYKQCINDFIAEQEYSINLHTESIQQARKLLIQQNEISSTNLFPF